MAKPGHWRDMTLTLKQFVANSGYANSRKEKTIRANNKPYVLKAIQVAKMKRTEYYIYIYLPCLSFVDYSEQDCSLMYYACFLYLLSLCVVCHYTAYT